MEVPNKSMGKMPSAASQMSLFHDDDFNSYTKVTRVMNRHTFKTNPWTTKKDFVSGALGVTIFNTRVTPSALYAIDDAGGFDKYI